MLLTLFLAYVIPSSYELVFDRKTNIQHKSIALKGNRESPTECVYKSFFELFGITPLLNKITL
uniref:Uncharacterized protein n=1 Tax=Anopheles minimus TaxID=112268 RepID=A0A182WNB3_9DIPT